MNNINFAQESELNLFESVLCGIFRYTISEDPEILQFNTTSAQIFGYETKEAFSKTTQGGLLSLIYEYDVEIVKRFLRRCIQKRQPVNFGHRILKKDKTIAYVIGTLSIVRLSDGQDVIQSVFIDSGHRVVQADIRKSIFYKPSETKKHAKKIILADENEANRAHIFDILKDEYELVEAKNGQEVLSILRKEQDEIAVILSSISIIVKNDYGFMASVRGGMQYTMIPIVVLGDSSESDEEEVLSYGVNEYLKMPLNPNVLKLRVANLIELRDTAIQRNAVETIVDNIPGGVMLVKVGKKLSSIFVSAGVAALGGRTEEEMEKLIKKDIIGTMIYEKDRPRVSAKIASAVASGNQVEFTARLVHKNQSLVWIHAHAVKVREEDECPVYQVIVSPTTAAEKMYQSMLDDAPGAISVLSMETNELLYINNAAAKLLEDFPKLNDYMEQLTFDEYTVKQIIPSNSKRHLILNGKLIDWNGIRSRIIYITDDTASYYAQLERHELYETEMIKQSTWEENVIGTAIFNLTQDRLMEFNTQMVLKHSIYNGKSIEETRDTLSNYVVKPREKEEFLNRFNRDNLLMEYRKGDRKISMQCRYQDNTGRMHWIRFTWNIIEKPTDGDILVFMYVHDIDEEVIRQTTYSRTLGMEAEVVSYLNLIDKTIHPLIVKENTIYDLDFTSMDYEEYIHTVIPDLVVKEDKERCISDFSMDNIMTDLKREPVCSIYFRTLYIDNKQYRKKVQAFYLDEDRQLICMVHTDVTDIYEEQQEQNHRLQVALDEAKQANEAKSMFLSRMSHEIRTPMNAILGLSGLAIDEIKDPNAMLDYLNKINSSGKYLLGLINDILDMSKIESERVQLNPEPYSIRECIDFIMVSMKTQIDKKKLEFTYQEENVSDEKIMLDKMRIQQIFFNLLSNAVKFTDVGGKISVSVKQLWEKDGCAKINVIVKDTGKGIAEDSLEQIFEPFEQAKRQNSAQYGGTGLGLAIVKNLVNLMNGTISVRSREGLGTEFTLDMLLPIAAKKSETEGYDQKNIPLEYDFEGKKVLLVEDHKINMEIVHKLLKRKNCAVGMACNGQEAVRMFEDSKDGEYQAILMDVRMPVMDGIEATKLIRKLEKKDAKSVPIIAMTANAFDEDALETKIAGMDAHLTKPISMDVLYQTLYEFILKEEKE
ncbi:MAG: response regulator [Clostridia bacterium]|nr:response regulator [Clostridia bacterium]